MNKQLKVLTVIFTLCASLSASYLRSNQADYSPKALSLGSSQVAIADSIDLLRYNSAGLSKIASDKQIYSSSLQGFDNLSQTIFLGYAQRFSKRLTTGVLFSSTIIDGINQTKWQNDRPLVVRKMNYLSNELMLACSFLISDNFSIGTNLRTGHKSFGGLYGFSLAVDLGLRYQKALAQDYTLSIGINFSDVGGTNFCWNNGVAEKIDFLSIAGIAITKKIWQTELGVVLDRQLDQQAETSLGIFCKLDFIVIRAGINEADQLCYGVGFDVFGCQLDYAQVQQKYLGEQKQLSLRINF